MTIKRKRLPTQDGTVGDFLQIQFEPGEVQEWLLQPTINNGSILLPWQTAGTLGGGLLEAAKELEEQK